MVIFITIGLIVGFKIGGSIVYKFINFDNYTDFLILEKKEKEIINRYIILEQYVYKTKKRLITYKKDKNNNLKVVKKDNVNIKRVYTKKNKKIDNIYDIFIYKGSSFEIRIDKMYSYNFKDLLDTFNIAPYYDTPNNTLYIFTHSSGKIYNLGLILFKMKIGEKIKFYDMKLDKMDTFKIINKKVESKKQFRDKRFLNFKNKIVFVTCYPFNSTANRLYVVLEKIN